MDTETPDNTETETPAAGKTRRSGKLDLKAGFVEIDGARYAISDLPDAAQDWCKLNGLRRHLLSAKLPAAAWSALQAGELPSDGAAKVKELDPWRKAYALALADKDAKAAGIKARTPEFAALLDERMQTAATLDRKAMSKARTIPAVVVHWNRLTGNEAAL